MTDAAADPTSAPTTLDTDADLDVGGDDRPLTADELAERYGFGDCCREAFDLAVAAWSSDDEPDWAAVADAVSHGTVTVAFAEWAATGPERPGGIEEFAAGLASAPGARAASGSVLLALAAHDDGDVLAEERALEAAIEVDPSSTIAAELLSSIAAERGDLDRAIRLLQRAGARSDHDELRFFRMLAAQLPSAAKVGRNEPCPCGSGRKFKACCLRSPVLPIDARVTWALHRMARYTIVGPPRFDLLELALAMADAAHAADHHDHGDHDHDHGDHDDDVGDRLARFFGDPFVCDLLMYEGGAAAEYLRQRGVLLADDERSWVDAWLAAPRRLWEVTGGDRAGALHLRHEATGDEVTLDAAELMRPGTGARVLCRIAEVAGQHRLGGTLLTIQPDDVDTVAALLEPGTEPAAWSSWYGPAAAASV